MRLAQAVLISACVLGLVTGPWASSVVKAQPGSPEVIREGTIVSINRQAGSFTISTGSPRRELTVLARGFTAISVARQGKTVSGSFASLAVGDYVVVHGLMLANGQALALSTNVSSRAPAGGPTTGSAQAGTSSASGTPSGGGSSGGGSSGGIGVSVDASGRGSGGGVSVDASGRGSGGGVSLDAGGRGGGGGASVDANVRGGN